MTTRCSRLLLLLATITACSCHNHGGPARDHYDINSPSAKIQASALSKPKDRHAMPIYTFGETKRLVRTTAYTCTEWDHLQYGNRSASGTPLLYGRQVRSAAADWSFYPVGTTFRIKGMPTLYVVDDYGSALTGTGTIDLYKPNKQLMKQWGRRNVELEVIQWGSYKRSVELLHKRTRHLHCRRMLDNILRLKPSLRPLAGRG